MLEIIGLAVFLAIAAALSPQFLALQQKSLERIRDTVVAGQMSQIVSAANQYIQANYNSLATNPGNQVITVQQLEQAGYLSPSVSQFTPYGQNWEVQVAQPKPGYLQGLVISTGGTPMTQVEMGQAADSTKGSGGFIPQAGFPGSGTTATGAYGGWQVSMAGYANPGPGHMVGLLTYYNGQSISNDYLYRVAIPNNHQLNTMQTDLDMGGNNISNANNIQASGGAITIGNEATTTCNPNARISMAGSQIWDGCDGDLHMQPGGGNGSSIFTTANIQVQGLIGAAGESATSGYPGGWGGGVHTWDLYANGTVGVGTNGSLTGYLNSQGYGYVQNNMNVGNALIVGNASFNGFNYVNGNGGFLYQDGDGGVSNRFTVNDKLILGSAFGSAYQGGPCSPNGALATNNNGTGQLMTCVNGTWQSPGGGSFSHISTAYIGNGYHYFSNNNSSPMFVSTNCPLGSGGSFLEAIQIGYDGIVSSEGDGNSSKGFHFGYIPGATAIIPPFTNFYINMWDIGSYFACTVNFQY